MIHDSSDVSVSCAHSAGVSLASRVGSLGVDSAQSESSGGFAGVCGSGRRPVGTAHGLRRGDRAGEQVAKPVLNQTLNGQVVDRPPAAPCRAGLGRGDGRRPIVGSDELFEEGSRVRCVDPLVGACRVAGQRVDV
jgi:hypothetical protein